MKLWFLHIHAYDGEVSMMTVANDYDEARKIGSDSVDGECYSVHAYEVSEVNGYKVSLSRNEQVV